MTDETRKSAPLRPKMNAWSLPALLVAAVAFAGCGGPADNDRPRDNPSGAGGQQASEPGTKDTAFSLAYVPRDALAVVAVRPATLLGRPALAAIRDAVSKASSESLELGLRPEEVSEFTLVLLPSLDDEPLVAFVVRTATAESVREFIQSVFSNAQPAEFATETYFRAPSRGGYFQPDDLTVVFSPDEPTLRRCIAAGTAGASTTKWADQWSTVGRQDAAAMVNTSLLRGMGNTFAAEALSELYTRRSRARDQALPLAYRLAPMWQRSEYAVAELNVSTEITLRVVSQSATAEEAGDVHGAVLTAISVARVALSGARHSVASMQGPAGPALLKNIDLVDEILEKARVTRQDAEVGLLVQADEDTTKQLTALAAPAALAAREAGSRSKSSTNLKQIALAFHNYHDTYKTFPAAVQIGPKDTPRSWRVTLLPFLDQQSLYKQYRQDEPWDSESNKRVLAQMPDVFRCPIDGRDSTNSSYFALVGPETVFDGNKCSRIASITDGTSNTILVVESRREIPWTKPEDVPFHSEEGLPPLGGWYPGGFLVAMCDGSARFFPLEIDEQTLRHAIMRADNHPVRLPEP